MDNLNDIIGKLNPEDIASLQAAASSIFGSEAPAFTAQEAQGSERQEQPQGASDFFGGINPEMLAKISRIMHGMNQKEDSRSGLIQALKPHLSPPRRKKADEALQMMHMMEMLPVLQEVLQQNAKPTE